MTTSWPRRIVWTSPPTVLDDPDRLMAHAAAGPLSLELHVVVWP